MATLTSVLSLAHLIGLVLGVGGATAKLSLLLKARSDRAFIGAYLTASKRLTRMIVTGLVLLALSGAGWVAVGYGFTPVLIVKIALVAVIFVIGPIIDNVVEPRFRALAPAAGEAPSPAFSRVERQYVTVETIATGLFYVIVVMWVLA